MKLIAAVDANWAIGREGDLLCHIPGDLKYFKEKTLDKVVVMGRVTLESLPGGKPLKNRINIVLSGNPDYAPEFENLILCRSQEELFALLKSDFADKEIMIIGGERIYREFLHWCEEAYITKMEKAFEADRYFENLDELENWELSTSSELHEENGIPYRFTIYRNNSPVEM